MNLWTQEIAITRSASVILGAQSRFVRFDDLKIKLLMVVWMFDL